MCLKGDMKPEYEKKITGDGTKVSGFVYADENMPPRQCDHCVWYKHDKCHNPIVMIDVDVPGKNGEPKPVHDEDCCNYFRSQERVLMYIVRHGETELNAKNAFRGWIDPSLDENGRKDAQKAGEWLKDKGIKMVYCSDLKRAVETAKIICEELGLSDPYKDFSLRPWNVGELAGKEKTKENEAQLDEYVDNPSWEIPEGESLYSFGDRIQEAVRYYIHEAREEGIKLIVTHTSDCIQFNDYCRGEGPAGKPEGGDIVAPGGILRISEKNGKLICKAVFKEKKDTAEYGAS